MLQLLEAGPEGHGQGGSRGYGQADQALPRTAAALPTVGGRVRGRGGRGGRHGVDRMVREVSNSLPHSETCVGMQEDGTLAMTAVEGNPPGAPEEGPHVVLPPPAAKADLWLYSSSSGSSDDWEPSNSRSTSVNRVSDDGLSEADSEAKQAGLSVGRAARPSGMPDRPSRPPSKGQTGID
jgi:hypothetical protein